MWGIACLTGPTQIAAALEHSFGQPPLPRNPPLGCARLPDASPLFTHSVIHCHLARCLAQDGATSPLSSDGDANPCPERDGSSGAAPPPLPSLGDYSAAAEESSPSVALSSCDSDSELSPLLLLSIEPGMPPVPRVSPEDERLASVDGHFLRRLIEAGLVDEEGNVTELGNRKVAPMDATYIHLTLNKMLSMNRRYGTVLAVIRDVGAYMGRVNVATAMHRLGRLVRSARSRGHNPGLHKHVVSRPQYQYLLRKAEEMVDGMAPRALANFLWGMAALGDDRNSGIVLRVGRRLLAIEPSQLKPQELSNILWAMATLEVYIPELVEAVLDSACSRIDECVPQALSNMIWACATLNHHNNRFAAMLAASAVPRLETFQSQTLANTLWAYSVLGIYPDDLFSKAADEVVRRIDLVAAGMDNAEDPTMTRFRGQEISNMLIAYARGCIIHPPLLQAVERELCRPVELEGPDGEIIQTERIQEFTSQALANTLWAFASLRWYPARLLPAITEAAGRIVQDMSAQELSNCLWSYARFAYHPGRVMASFLAVMEQRIDEFMGQGCTNSLWALAVLKATHSSAFVGLLQRYVALEGASTNFGELQYNQVLQAVLLAQFEARGGRVAWRPEVDLPESVVDRALAAWCSQQMPTQLSGFHLDVSEGLTRLGVPHLIEHLVARDLLSIDIAVINQGRKVAIEVDGPFHFPVNARTPLGHTMIRRRLLRAAGWTVVSIPWYEWFQMESWDERLQYLTQVLSKADESFAHELRPATKELLSTNFAPGPGPGAEEGQRDAAAGRGDSAARRKASGGSVDEAEDGPVLRDDSPRVNPAVSDVDSSLLQVLARSNIRLTSGAVRRLQNMGLNDIVREVGERRRGEHDRAMAAETYSPPPSTSSKDGDPSLLPKPQMPNRGRTGRSNVPHRFTPRIFSSSDDEVWGFYPNEDDDVGKLPRRNPSPLHSGRRPPPPAHGSMNADDVIRRVLHDRRSGAPPPSPPQKGKEEVERERGST